MAKRWQIAPHDPVRIARLEKSAGISSVVAQLLICRGIDNPTDARGFLEPKLTGLHEPDRLPGVTLAAERLAAAVREQRRVVVYGDYDADGMSAASILVRCLNMLGANVGYYVPNRMDEGYGLNDQALRTLAKDGAKTVITVDCGIASIEEADVARQLGLELIVTDHHEMGESLPDADVLVHPRLPGGDYPFGHLAGAGVALKVAWALCQQMSRSKRVSDPMRAFLLQAVGLAAIGTVADVVPLVDENRVLVRHGLNSLSQFPIAGISELLKITGLTDKQRLSSEDVAFMVAPRLNAAGRLGQAQLAIELLTTDEPGRATALAEYIHQLNESRQSLERSIYLAANKQAKERFDPQGDTALVLAARGWHPGVIGIVAGRLAEKYHRPVILIAQDEMAVKPAVGSARSVDGFNLHAALACCNDHLISHGGHAAAAGLKIADEQIDCFRDAFCEHASAEIAPADRAAYLSIDVEAPFTGLTHQTVNQIESLAPFGHGNQRPVLCTTGVALAGEPTRIGGGGRHLSMKLAQQGVTLRAVAFGGGDWSDDLQRVTQPMSVAYKPVINEFRGRRSVELQLVDWCEGEPDVLTNGE